MALILPGKKHSAAHHPISLPVGQFYSHKDVANRKAAVPDIVREIQPVPRSEALRWLCSIAKAIQSEGGMNPHTHFQWAKQVFPNIWCAKLDSLLQADGADAGRIFHRRAIWLVLQFTVLSCRDTDDKLPMEEIANRMGRACFMAGDVLNDIEAAFQGNLPKDNTTEWMVALLVPMLDTASGRIDFDLLGRSLMLWEEVPQDAEFQAELSNKNLVGFEEVFHNSYGISLSEFLRFLAAIYARIVGRQLKADLNPLLLDLANDEVGKAFAQEFRDKAIALISQTPDELAVRLLRTRQSWAYDVTPIREGPLVEVLPGNYCCPDLGMFVRTFLDRIFFLLQDAYGKGEFRALAGKLFECYVHRLISEFAVTEGAGRTYVASPRFTGSQDEAADGVLFWTDTAVAMEYKAGLLTTRQRYAGVPSELFQGIGSLLGRGSGKGHKGVVQLARNIARILSDKGAVVCQGNVFDLSDCKQIFPVLVCLDETLGIHAVQKWLQPQFEKELAQTDALPERVGPLMVLTVRDVESLTTAGKSVSIEHVIVEYAKHLTTQPKDYTGSFSRFLQHTFGTSIRWDESVTYRKHTELLQELMPRFGESTTGDDITDNNADHSNDAT